LGIAESLIANLESLNLAPSGTVRWRASHEIQGFDDSRFNDSRLVILD